MATVLEELLGSEDSLSLNWGKLSNRKYHVNYQHVKNMLFAVFSILLETEKRQERNRQRQAAVWLTGLKDLSARSRILNRMDNIQKGSLGDHKSLGKGLFELRIHYGPGYRVYFTRRDNTIIFLLIGGDKSSQAKDIAAARSMMEE